MNKEVVRRLDELAGSGTAVRLHLKSGQTLRGLVKDISGEWHDLTVVLALIFDRSCKEAIISADAISAFEK